jgi:hypothetical protein
MTLAGVRRARAIPSSRMTFDLLLMGLLYHLLDPTVSAVNEPFASPARGIVAATNITRYAAIRWWATPSDAGHRQSFRVRDQSRRAGRTTQWASPTSTSCIRRS